MGQWGQDKTHPAGGTTPETLQQVFGAQWVNSQRNPLIGGGTVTTRGDLRFGFAAGTGLIKTAAGAMYVTWPAGQTKLIGQPATTTTYIVFVDSTGQVDVAIEGTVNESNVCVLERMELDGGATQTQGRSRRKANRVYALPYGGSLGWLVAYKEYRSGLVPSPADMFEGRFTVASDRLVNIHVEHAIFTNVSGGQGWVRYEVLLNNALLETFELPYSRGYAVQDRSLWAVNVPQGTHTIRVRRTSVAGDPAFFFGGGSEKLSGGFVGVQDVGVAE